MSPDRELVSAAEAARNRAYAPYSKFAVGAALRLQDGSIVTGANVENASYGLTVCAERAAVVAAVSQGRLQPGGMMAVAVAADSLGVAAPCGACRQVLHEFAHKTALVLLHNVRDANTLSVPFSTLLPHAFGPESLNSADD